MRNIHFQNILLTFFLSFFFLQNYSFALFYFIFICLFVCACVSHTTVETEYGGKFFFFFLSFLFLFLVKCKSSNLIRMRHYTKFFPIPRGERTRKGKATPTEKWGRVRIFEKIRETHCVGGPTIVLGPTGSMIKLENQLHGLRGH